MKRSIVFASVLLAMGAAPAIAGPGAPGHSHHMTGFSAGEPGEAGKPARVVEVTMKEIDGQMLYLPDRIELRKGEQIRFVLRNLGGLDHEFVLAITRENLKHAEEMKKNPDMEHDDPNGRRIAPNKTDDLVWKFTKRGTFEFGCLIPGHREAGMVGTVIVK